MPLQNCIVLFEECPQRYCYIASVIEREGAKGLGDTKLDAAKGLARTLKASHIQHDMVADKYIITLDLPIAVEVKQSVCQVDGLVVEAHSDTPKISMVANMIPQLKRPRSNGRLKSGGNFDDPMTVLITTAVCGEPTAAYKKVLLDMMEAVASKVVSITEEKKR